MDPAFPPLPGFGSSLVGRISYSLSRFANFLSRLIFFPGKVRRPRGPLLPPHDGYDLMFHVSLLLRCPSWSLFGRESVLQVALLFSEGV